jgi:hypothetical protein
MAAHPIEGDWPFQEQFFPRFLAGGMSLLRDWTEALFDLLCHHAASSPRRDWMNDHMSAPRPSM